MIPVTLQSFLDNSEAEDIKISLREVSFDDNSTILNLTFKEDVFIETAEEMEVQHWQVIMTSVLDFRINGKVFYQFELLKDHPFLLEYNSPRSSLYIADKVENKNSLIVELYKVHIGLFGSTDRFMDYINSELQLEKILDASSALLANGPLPVLEAYARCLKNHNIRHNIIPPYLPTYWNGEGHVQTLDKLQILLMEDSYFIFEGITFNQSNKDF